MKCLAAFIFFKSRYSNSCYYGWSINSIARKTGLSRTSVRKYITFFMVRGWCEDHQGNLLFKKTGTLYCNNKKLKNQYVKINITKNSSITEVLDELYYCLLKRSADRFEYMKKLWEDKTCGHYPDLQHYKTVKKRCHGREIKSGEIPGYQMSLKKISELFKVSISAASRIIKRLNTANKVLVRNNHVCLGNIINQPWLRHAFKWDPGTYISGKGFVVRKLANSYVF